MHAKERVGARRQLDKRLGTLENPDMLTRPPRGWVKAIREALGMSATQLAKRLGVSQQRALVLEKAEVSGSITLQSLERAAQALECRLVYALIPRKPLQTLVEERAALLAKKRLQATRHSMELEAQRVEEADEDAQFQRLTRLLEETGGSALWDDE